MSAMKPERLAEISAMCGKPAWGPVSNAELCILVAAATANAELVAALRLVQQGIRKGNIKDQSIFPAMRPDATSVDVVSLSSIIDAALLKAEGRS